MSDVELIFGGIGALSAIVSIISAYFSHLSKTKAEKVSKEIEKTQKIIAEELKRLNDEKEKFYRPIITIDVEKYNGFYYFVIKNIGWGIAEKIKIICNEEKTLRYNEKIRRHLNKEFRLNPGKEIHEQLHPVSLEPTYYSLKKYLPNEIDLEISYEDEYGNEYKEKFDRKLTDYD